MNKFISLHRCLAMKWKTKKRRNHCQYSSQIQKKTIRKCQACHEHAQKWTYAPERQSFIFPSSCYRFLWIVHFLLPLRYSLTFISPMHVTRLIIRHGYYLLDLFISYLLFFLFYVLYTPHALGLNFRWFHLQSQQAGIRRSSRLCLQNGN